MNYDEEHQHLQTSIFTSESSGFVVKHQIILDKRDSPLRDALRRSNPQDLNIKVLSNKITNIVNTLLSDKCNLNQKAIIITALQYP